MSRVDKVAQYSKLSRRESRQTSLFHCVCGVTLMKFLGRHTYFTFLMPS